MVVAPVSTRPRTIRTREAEALLEGEMCSQAEMNPRPLLLPNAMLDRGLSFFKTPSVFFFGGSFGPWRARCPSCANAACCPYRPPPLPMLPNPARVVRPRPSTLRTCAPSFVPIPVLQAAHSTGPRTAARRPTPARGSRPSIGALSNTALLSAALAFGWSGALG